MQMLYKILVLLLVIAAGYMLVPLFVNLMIKFDLIDAASLTPELGADLVQKSVFVWMGAIILGIISLFIQQSWRIVLLLSPLVLPTLFLLVYGSL